MHQATSGSGPTPPAWAVHESVRLTGVLRTCRSSYQHSRILTQPGHRAERKAAKCATVTKYVFASNLSAVGEARSIRKRRALLCAFGSIAELLIADSF